MVARVRVLCRRQSIPYANWQEKPAETDVINFAWEGVQVLANAGVWTDRSCSLDVYAQKNARRVPAVILLAASESFVGCFYTFRATLLRQVCGAE